MDPSKRIGAASLSVLDEFEGEFMAPIFLLSGISIAVSGNDEQSRVSRPYPVLSTMIRQDKDILSGRVRPILLDDLAPGVC